MFKHALMSFYVDLAIVLWEYSIKWSWLVKAFAHRKQAV